MWKGELATETKKRLYSRLETSYIMFNTRVWGLIGLWESAPSGHLRNCSCSAPFSLIFSALEVCARLYMYTLFCQKGYYCEVTKAFFSHDCDYNVATNSRSVHTCHALLLSRPDISEIPLTYQNPVIWQSSGSWALSSCHFTRLKVNKSLIRDLSNL